MQHTNYLRPHQKGTNEDVKRQILIVERVQIPLVFSFAFVREKAASAAASFKEGSGAQLTSLLTTF